MTDIDTCIDAPPTGVHISDDRAALSTFMQTGCAAAIWRRQLPNAIRTWLDGLDPDQLPRGRVVVPPYTVPDLVAHILENSGSPAGAEREWLQSDIAALAAEFSDLMDVKFLRLRLDVVSTNACRRFHIDAVTARLLCTYRGTGTQIANSIDGNDPKPIFTVQTGSPIVLRGTLGLIQSPSGLLHRSPPIEGTGETRLVLVLDPIYDLDAEV